LKGFKPEGVAAGMEAKTSKSGKTKIIRGERPAPMPAEELQAYLEKEMAPAALRRACLPPPSRRKRPSYA
jgi:hypothetical protein